MGRLVGITQNRFSCDKLLLFFQPSGVQSNRARQAADNQALNNQAEDANNQALQVPSAAQVRRGFGSRESQDDERHAGEDRQVIRARRRLPEVGEATQNSNVTIKLFCVYSSVNQTVRFPSEEKIGCKFGDNSMLMIF